MEETMRDLVERNATPEEFSAYSSRVIQEKADLETAAKKAEFDLLEDSNLVQLPLWPIEARGIPNCILRGSLFAAIDRRHSYYCERRTIVDSDEMEIVYTGMRLSQCELDVWETILHLAKDQKLGEVVHYNIKGMLKLMGRSNGSKDRERLKNMLSRLSATSVQITFKNQPEYSYEGSLISEILTKKTNDKQVIFLNPKLHRLFLAGNTWISWEDRNKIGNHPTAKWLHGYMCTHATWYGHKTSTLAERSGGGFRPDGKKRLPSKNYNQKLKSGLDRLLEVGLIEDYEITKTGLLNLTRVKSGSQKKHLEKKQEEWRQEQKELKRQKALSRNTRAD